MASGDTLLSFGPLSNQPPASGYATLDTRNSIPVLDFDAASIESAVFSGSMPENYSDATGITIEIDWTASSATSGNVIWGIGLERGVGQDIDSDGFASNVTAAGAANGTSGIQTTTSIALTKGAQMDSVVAGDRFRLRLQRIANDGGDTMTGDAELLAIRIIET